MPAVLTKEFFKRPVLEVAQRRFNFSTVKRTGTAMPNIRTVSLDKSR